MLTLRNLFPLLLIVSLPLTAQKLKKADKAVIERLRAHVKYLADDKLEGRRAGTNGEKLAMEYIAAEFKSSELVPKGDSGYYQSFGIWDGRNFDRKSYLFINGNKISPEEFYPLPSSPEKMLEAFPSIALKEAGEPWFLDEKEDLEAGGANPHFSLSGYLADKARAASKKGATALIVYNSGTNTIEQKYDPKERLEPTAIPVLIVNNNVAKKYFKDETASINIRLKVRFEDDERTGHNVIGYIDNGAKTTVLIGAHFDHLGYGEDGNTLYQQTGTAVYNGADDNASGTAAVIELSRLIKKSRLKNNNYLFIAFSGEELGLFGSKYFADHPTVDLAALNYMINMDMIGRLNDSSKVLTIGGYGTSSLWPRLFTTVKDTRNLINKYDSSGSGPSDHTSFYNKNIPVLFFFTGLHSDYHKPSDDYDKLNYEGEYRIIKYIYKIIETADKSSRLDFVKTRDSQADHYAQFTVTMGIMPDYTFNGSGVRIDGVSAGRPAEKAGLHTGDVVVKLGDNPVLSLETYMEALSKFKEGDKTKVTVTRNGQTFEADIIF